MSKRKDGLKTFNIDKILDNGKSYDELYSTLNLFFVLDIFKINRFRAKIFGEQYKLDSIGVLNYSEKIVCSYDERLCNPIIIEFVSTFSSVNFAYHYDVINYGAAGGYSFCGRGYSENFGIIQIVGIAYEFHTAIDLSDTLSLVQRVATLRGEGCND